MSKSESPIPTQPLAAADARRAVETGEAIAVVAKRLSVARPTVRDWRAPSRRDMFDPCVQGPKAQWLRDVRRVAEDDGSVRDAAPPGAAGYTLAWQLQPRPPRRRNDSVKTVVVHQRRVSSARLTHKPSDHFRHELSTDCL